MITNTDQAREGFATIALAAVSALTELCFHPKDPNTLTIQTSLDQIASGHALLRQVMDGPSRPGPLASMKEPSNGPSAS
mgnify:CR=1 FL=1